MPGWLLELVAPYGGAVLADVSMLVSNAKAKRGRSWAPQHPSLRDGIF